VADDWLEKVPGIKDIVDDTAGGAIVLPRETVLVLKGAVTITPTALGIELDFTGGGGGGGGDVVGPASATNNRVAVYADGTGKLLKDVGLPYTLIVRADGTVAFAANQSFGGFKATSLGTGTASTDGVNKGQMDSAIAVAVTAVIDWKSSVKAATTAALAASARVGNVRTADANGAFPTVDGVTVVLNDAILDKDHATGADRGVWALTDAGSGGTPWVLTRRSDFDADAEVTTGATMLVEQGTASGGKFYFLSTTGAIVVNTTALAFTQLAATPPDAVSIEINANTLRRAALTGDVTASAGSNATTIANDAVTFAKLQNIATNSLVGRDTASTGDPENILLDAATLEMDGSGNLRVPSQLGARGGENVIVDLYPSTQSQGTLATATSVNFDIAIPTGKRVTITWDVWVDDGAGGACLYLKALQTKYHQTGGAAVEVGDVTLSAPLEGAGFTFTVAPNSTNARGTLSNTSGTTRSYNIAAGFWSMDKP